MSSGGPERVIAAEGFTTVLPREDLQTSVLGFATATIGDGKILPCGWYLSGEKIGGTLIGCRSSAADHQISAFLHAPASSGAGQICGRVHLGGFQRGCCYSRFDVSSSERRTNSCPDSMPRLERAKKKLSCGFLVPSGRQSGGTLMNDWRQFLRGGSFCNRLNSPAASGAGCICRGIFLREEKEVGVAGEAFAA